MVIYVDRVGIYITMRRLRRSDIQYQLYLHMLPREDSVDQIYNTNPIYIFYHEKTQSIRYTIPTCISYRLSLLMVTYVDRVGIVYLIDWVFSWVIYVDNTNPIYIYYPWVESVNQIYNTDPIYIYYHEKTQSIRYTIPTLSTYITKRRLSQSDIQYRPYLHILPMSDRVGIVYLMNLVFSL
jgi:hypothetical protein